MHRRAKRVLLAAALLALPVRASLPEAIKFYGYAYELKSGKYLYTELYDEQVEDVRWEGGRTRYYAPDGTQIGEKRIDFSADPFVPVYTLDLPYLGYSEGISRISANRIDMFKQSREYGRQTASISRLQPMAADAGFHAFIVAHMDALVDGRTLAFKFGVAGQLSSYGFRVRKVGDTKFDGQPAIKLQIEPDSLLRYAVEPLRLTYDPVARRLLEYDGLSNLINPSTGKAYNVRIVYTRKPPDDAPKNLPPLD